MLLLRKKTKKNVDKFSSRYVFLIYKDEVLAVRLTCHLLEIKLKIKSNYKQLI